MRPIDVTEHFNKLGTWVDWKNTTDHYLTGDQNTEITGIAVAWQVRTAALKKAVEHGCNFFISHEQLYYHEISRDEAYEAEKAKFIKDNNLVIYRCHDLWDQMPEYGIVDSWAAHLGLDTKLNSIKFHSLHRAPRSTVGELAEYVLDKTKNLDQDSVQILGNPKARVNAMAIGCGAIVDTPKMLKMGADVILATEDSLDYWGRGSWALDHGVPLIIVNHATSEEPGVRNLARYVARTFPSVKTIFVPQGCFFRTVG